MTDLPFEIDAAGKGPLGMPAPQFLQDYWQKRPLLIRNALEDFQSPLEPEDLAGLACEELALSRLIAHNPETDEWSVENGPFPEERFPGMPDHDWTLLVQDVDKWDPDVADILNAFDFLPRWRIDDIMISFAATGGNVGAHVDHYDVFLLQGLGQRRWQIDASESMGQSKPDLAFRDDVDIKLLRTFNSTHEWTLNPGDMLYLPPEVPHHGIAVNPCLTYSVGMRAPSRADLIADFADQLAARQDEDQRYVDPDLQVQADAREIDAQAIARVRTAMRSLLESPPDALAQWFGQYITSYRNAGEIVPSEERPDRTAMDIALRGGLELHRHPFSNMAWMRLEDDRALLFFNGDAIPLTATDAAALAHADVLTGAEWVALGDGAKDALPTLFAAGQYALVKP